MVPEETAMVRHILIPVDGSRAAARAARAAVALARATGARVTGLFVAPPATPVVYRGLLPVDLMTPQQHEALIERTAAKVLGVVEKAAAAAGVECETLHVTGDFPAEAIVDVARRRRCDLIFIAPRSRHDLSDILLGSQTRKVLSLARLPVLVHR
jgi:nucleotide-binding universal stress UspA family protein